jgi:hypothetical protein
LATPPLFEQRIWGRFSGVLRWSQLDALWDNVRRQPAGWFIYDLHAPPPDEPAAPKELETFLRKMDRRLRKEHEYDYCGIVYADSFEVPTMVKVYDPGNLGAVCGPTGAKVLPRWVLSRTEPTAIAAHSSIPSPAARWWRRILCRD